MRDTKQNFFGVRKTMCITYVGGGWKILQKLSSLNIRSDAGRSDRHEEKIALMHALYSL